MKVAALQMVSGLDVEANLEAAKRLMVEARAQGAELAVLPEYFCLMGLHDHDKLAIQEDFGRGPIQSFLAASAKALGLWLVGGTLPIRCDLPGVHGRVFNACLVYSPEGQCVARYDKVHLFRFDNGQERYDESRVLQAGHLPAHFSLPSLDGHIWKIGLSVCYDLRFPELYRHYAAAGVDLFLAPSAFTHATGQVHWDVLLRARAIENLAYMLAAAQGGMHANGRKTWGHSMVVDPWGAVMTHVADGEAVVVADCDAERLRFCQQQLPTRAHHVLDGGAA